MWRVVRFALRWYCTVGPTAVVRSRVQRYREWWRFKIEEPHLVSTQLAAVVEKRASSLFI